MTARRSRGFASALALHHLGWALVGTTLGTAVGVLPGIGPALTVAVLLPVTFNLDPISAFIMFGGIYYGRDVWRLDDEHPAQHAG